MGTLHNQGEYPGTAEDHARLRGYQAKCLEVATRNPHENRVFARLKKSSPKWGRQKSLGWRIADFWNRQLGVIVEVDGKTHRKSEDEKADQIHAERSAILVYRIKNGASDADIDRLMERIAQTRPWNERRAEVGLKPIGNAQ